jgi:GNAT superfamily N-acetyltransferase
MRNILLQKTAGITDTPAFKTDTPAFKTWFAGSQVVDAEGNPKLMTHGTLSDIDVFRPYSHFGPPATARSRLKMRGVTKEMGAKTIPVYLSIKNPMRLTDQQANHADTYFHYAMLRGEYPELKEVWGKNEPITEALKKLGYDGFVYENEGEGGGDSYVIFSPHQVKSAIGNSGEFNPEEMSITASPIGETDTPDFKSWFSGSKIVGKNGSPKLVYHGTSARDFETFNIPVYFSDNLKYTKDFGSRTVRAYLNMKNPLYLDTRTDKDAIHVEESLIRKPEWRNEQKAKGHDGVVITDFDGKNYNLHVFLPFNSDQIWIADQGEFKTASPDYGYHQYNDREKDIKKLRIQDNNLGKHLLETEAIDPRLKSMDKTQGYVCAENFGEDDETGRVPAFYISRSFINPEWYGTGLGQILYDRVIRQAKNRGADYIYSDTDRSDEAESAWNRLSKRWPVDYDRDKQRYVIPLNGGQAKAASPDFGYTDYNDKEDKIDQVEFDYRNGEIIAEYNGEEVGWIYTYRRASTVCVSEINIGDYWRGTGLGQMLYDKAIEMAAESGARYFASDSKLSNDAQNAWLRLEKRYPVEEMDNPEYEEGFNEEVSHVIYRIDLKKVPKVKSASETDPFWERIKRDFLAGIVYHGTTLEVAEIVMKTGFRGLDFDAIVADVLAKHGLTEVPKRMRKVLEGTNKSYTGEHGMVSTCPGGHVPTLYAGDGGEVPKQVEAYVLNKYRPQDVKVSLIKGDPAVLKCRIKNFEGSENQRRVTQLITGMGKMLDAGTVTGRKYEAREAAEYLWRGYNNLLCKPEDLEVLEVITGAQVEELANHPLGVSLE